MQLRYTGRRLPTGAVQVGRSRNVCSIVKRLGPSCIPAPCKVQQRFRRMRKISVVVRADKSNAGQGDFVKVKFLLPNCFVNFNERLRVVGSGSITGLWTAEAVPEKEWQCSGYWTAEVYLPPGRYAFKVTTIRPDGFVDWEKGKSREFEVPKNINETLLQTIPSTSMGERRPLQINLERWFDVDALISGLEGKRKSLHASISELQSIIKTGNGMESISNTSGRTNNDDEQRGEGGKDKKSKWGGMMNDDYKKSEKGGDKDEGKSGNKGKGGGPGGWAPVSPDRDAVQAYTSRMTAAEDEYMSKVWKDLVTEVVDSPSGGRSGGGGFKAPSPAPARVPARETTKKEDLGLGVTSLRVANPVESMAHAPALQLVFPGSNLRTLQPRPWVFNPLTGKYERAPLLEEDTLEPVTLLLHAVDGLARREAHVDAAASSAHVPPKRPGNGQRRLSDPPHDFLLIDTDSIPLGMALPTLDDVLQHPGQLHEPHSTALHVPQFRDTDSMALPSDQAAGPSPFVGVNDLIRSMQVPFEMMDFNEAFRLASSSFPRPVLPPDEHNHALDAAEQPPIVRQHRTLNPASSSSAESVTSHDTSPASCTSVSRATLNAMQQVPLCFGIYPIMHNGLPVAPAPGPSGPACPVHTAAAIAALGALRGVTTLVGGGGKDVPRITDSTVERCIDEQAASAGFVHFEQALPAASDDDDELLDWAGAGEDLDQLHQQNIPAHIAQLEMMRLLAEVNYQLKQVTAKLDRISPTVFAESAEAVVPTPPGEVPSSVPAVVEGPPNEMSSVLGDEAQPTAEQESSVVYGVDGGSTCVMRLPKGTAAGSYSGPEGQREVEDVPSDSTAPLGVTFNTWAQQQAAAQGSSGSSGGVPVLPSRFNTLRDEADGTPISTKPPQPGQQAPNSALQRHGAAAASAAAVLQTLATSKLAAKLASYDVRAAGASSKATAVALQAASHSVAATASAAARILSAQQQTRNAAITTTATVRQFVNAHDTMDLYMAATHKSSGKAVIEQPGSSFKALRSAVGGWWGSLINLGHRREQYEADTRQKQPKEIGAALASQASPTEKADAATFASKSWEPEATLLDATVMETLVQQAVRPLV